LTSKDAVVRRNAAFALGKAGSLAVSAAPKLVHALKDKNAEVREAAAMALGQIGPSGWDETFPALVDLLNQDRDARVRRSAAFALGSLGHAGMPAEEETCTAIRTALEKALGDTEVPVRQNAARALGSIGAKHARSAVPALAKLLEDSDPLVRRATA